MEGLALIFLLSCCFVLGLTIAIAIAVRYSSNRTGPKAEVVIPKLAAEMGLKPTHSQRGHRFAGTYLDHAFTLEPGTYGTHLLSNPGAGRPAIAVALEVWMKEPKAGYAYCNSGRVGPSTDFDSAFSAKLQYEWISPAARAAMLAFVRRREDLFFDGLPIHPKSKPNVPAQVRLQHNLPVSAGISRTDIRTVLDELIDVARIIEATC